MVSPAAKFTDRNSSLLGSFVRMEDKVNETAPEHQYPFLERLLFEKKLQLKGVWTCRDAAQVFGVGARTISDWIKQGKLNARDLPGHGRFLSEDLEQFLQSRSREPRGGRR